MTSFVSNTRSKSRRKSRRAIAGSALLAALLLVVQSAAESRPAAPGAAAILPIHGPINDITRDSLQRRIDDALARGIRTLVFELDTPGGMVSSALDICRMIKNLPPDVRTVAWVRHTAYSAGAMIAVACERIVMSASSAIGDCAPIMVSPVGGMENIPTTERAKIESPILQEFRDSAARNGYDPLLCQAMVSVGVEVWWVEHVESGKREFVTTQVKNRRVDEADADSREWKLVERYTDTTGKSVELAQPIDHAETLLTLSQGEAIAFGLAIGIAGDEAELGSLLALPEAPTRLDITGWESFAQWLNSPVIRGILFMIVLVGGYIEFQNPGLILPGAASLLALAVFLAAPYSAGLADIWTLILLVIGLLLIGVEIFVLPGFGAAGIIGAILVLTAFLGTFVPSEPGLPPFSLPTLQGTWDAIKIGTFVLAGGMLAALIGIAFLLRYLPSLPGTRNLVLANPGGAAVAPAMREPYPDTALVGDVGIVTGALRPGGQARFGSEIVEVQSQGEYVDAGRKVQVIRRDPAVIVRPVPEEQA